MTPQYLTLAQIKKAARKYYAAGKLTAQNSGPCVYAHGEFRCAIGAALDDETLERVWFNGLNDGNTLSELIGKGIVSMSGDVAAALKIQRAHDNWAAAVAAHDDETAAKDEREFKRLIK